MSEIRDDSTNAFLGFAPRSCGEHRTVGAHRAWCHECGEWCYPRVPCRGCEDGIAPDGFTSVHINAHVMVCMACGDSSAVCTDPAEALAWAHLHWRVHDDD